MYKSMTGGCFLMLFVWFIFWGIWFILSVLLALPVMILMHDLDVPGPYAKAAYMTLAFLIAIPMTPLTLRRLDKLFAPRTRTPVVGRSVAEPRKDLPSE